MTTTLASDRPAATTAESRASNRNSEVDWRGTELPQHMQALEVANRIRSEMAERKVAIAAMERREAMLVVADLLDDPDPITARMQLRTLLCAIPRVRVRMAEKMLSGIGLPFTVLHRQIAGEPTKRLARSLSTRQRSAIASDLRAQANGMERSPS